MMLHSRMSSTWSKHLPAVLGTILIAGAATAAPPAPPAGIQATDRPLDGGHQIDLIWGLSPDDTEEADHKLVVRYKIQRSGERNGRYTDVTTIQSDKEAFKTGEIKLKVEKCVRGEEHWFRVLAIGPGDTESTAVTTREAALPTREWLDGTRIWLSVITLIVCGSVVLFIQLARSGRPLKLRKIAGLEAVDEAVGRATEMGRSVLFIAGIQDMNDIQTVAGITVLSRVAKVAAEHDAILEVPTSRSLVMTTARETVQAAFMAAGRPDAYNEDRIYYVTDEQFGYVAAVAGLMVREKPAACFYMGSFFAESLILAETGNSVGAIQVAGTAQPAQLPFFVAACDYTLIGEEFFAASAYLSGEPEQLGSLKGQDVGKLIVGVQIILGCLLATLANLWPDADSIAGALNYLTEHVLHDKGFFP